MFSKKVQFNLCIGIIIITGVSYHANGTWKCPSCKDWFNKGRRTQTLTTTPKPGPAGCKRGNESCSDSSECCEICTKEKLCSCLPLQGNCAVDGQCCSGICCGKQFSRLLKQCQEIPCDCADGFSTCVSAMECCSKKCENGRCACQLNGTSCQSNTERCSFLCNGTTGKCERDCKALGKSCRLPTECCDGACILNKCVKCLSVGSSCGITNMACCGSCEISGVCLLSRASRSSFPGDPCNTKSDCNHRADCEKNGLCGIGSTVGDACRRDNDCFPNGHEQCNSSTGLCELKI